MKRLAVLAAAVLMVVSPTLAAGPEIPNFWDSRERLVRPSLDGVTRVRFLTTVDFPPFNHVDADGRLVGFHIDLARRLCLELDIAERCQIQALPWGEIDEAMERGDGEAILAGLAITPETRERYVFSRPFMKFAARFVVPRSAALVEPMHVSVRGKRVGVIAGSAHERMLRAYFPAALPVTYTRSSWLQGDLKDGKIDAAFGDGMRLAFWLAGTDSAQCCRFAGGPYLAPEFLGRGLSIAVKPDDAPLAAAFDYALRELQVKGGFAELYLRYFPVSFY